MREATKNQPSDTSLWGLLHGEEKESSFNRIFHRSGCYEETAKLYIRMMKAEVLFLSGKTSKNGTGNDKVYQG